MKVTFSCYQLKMDILVQHMHLWEDGWVPYQALSFHLPPPPPHTHTSYTHKHTLHPSVAPGDYGPLTNFRLGPFNNTVRQLSFNVTIGNDSIPEDAEMFNVSLTLDPADQARLGNRVTVSPHAATITIQDNDGMQLYTCAFKQYHTCWYGAVLVVLEKIIACTLWCSTYSYQPTNFSLSVQWSLWVMFKQLLLFLKVMEWPNWLLASQCLLEQIELKLHFSCLWTHQMEQQQVCHGVWSRSIARHYVLGGHRKKKWTRNHHKFVVVCVLGRRRLCRPFHLQVSSHSMKFGAGEHMPFWLLRRLK